MHEALITELRGIVGADHVKTGEPERIAYASDMWPRHQIWKLGGEIARHPPDAVVWPGSEAEVCAVSAAALRHRAPLIPYGAGSGVCGGTMPVRGGVVMDLKRLRRVLATDDRDLTVTAEAGILGMHLEEELHDRGYTLGHFPSSILCSTLGGWLAARSAGQLSSKYGKIEDMVVGLRAVLPGGDVLVTGPDAPFDWTQVVVGSEGTLATITAATLRVHPKPEAQVFRSFRFRTVEAGLHAIRLVLQAGLSPHVVRLYDPFDSLLQGGGSGAATSSTLGPLTELLGGTAGALKKRTPKLAVAMALSVPAALNKVIDALPVSSLLILGFEGIAGDAEADLGHARRLIEVAGGVDGGEGPGRRWLENRYAVSFKQAPIFEAGAFVDTMEVSCPWSRLSGLYAAVREALSPHVLVMAHFSHAYREGCSIYFTFAGYKRDAAAAERHYDRVWSEGLSAVLRAGGSVSHHHGVGFAKRDTMRREHGAGIRLLYGVKDAFDPHEVMNPGKVLPDRAVHA